MEDPSIGQRSPDYATDSLRDHTAAAGWIHSAGIATIHADTASLPQNERESNALAHQVPLQAEH
jgi:hypothetical protein